ncbi:MAG: phosphohydrolase, partial [Pseudopedobacter sp.]|nr:phosphohydrolase [Deinococcales bacterium]
MFRRKATPVETPSQSVNLEPDLFRSLPEVFSSRSVDMLMGSVLNHALQIAPQATRAYAVMRTGADRVVAVKGYGIELIGLELTGSWKNGMPKISTNLSSDLFGPNTPEVRAKLDAQGMREVRQSLIAPIRDRNQMFG